MEKSICQVFDDAQRNPKVHERLALTLLRLASTDLHASVAVIEPCLDLVVATARNEQAVKNLMAFLGVVCAASTSAAAAVVDGDDEATVASTQKQRRGKKQQQQQPSQQAVDGEPHPLALWLLAYAVTCSRAADKIVRARGCEVGAVVLENLPEDANLSEQVWGTAAAAALARLSDTQSAVRMQACRFSERLQSPQDPEDPITRRLAELLRADSSVQVRCAAVRRVAVTNATLSMVLARARDVNAGVRAAALDVVRTSIPMPALPIAARTGLLDQVGY
jgi:hypothetical protein